MSTNEHTKKTKRGVAAGLTVGLLGGTAAGLVFGVPSLTGAASDSPAAIVQQVEPDTTTPDAGAPEVAPDAERGSRIREILQKLVDDGTLTAAQADAVTAELVANAPEHGRHGPGGGRFGRFDDGVVTELLGIDLATLRSELQAGATLVEVAANHGVSEQELVDALVAAVQARVDQAVADGKISAEVAADRLADLEARITDRVNGIRPDRPGHADTGS